MKSILLAILGLFIGAFVNMGIIQLGTYLVKAPGNYDLSTEEGLAQAMPLMGFEHFVFPFLAHALGTLVGAYFVTKMKVDKPLLKSMAIGFAFLAGGNIMALSIPNIPNWFILLDIQLAYLPMAYLGYRLARIGATQ
jgi:hypothetical protein